MDINLLLKLAIKSENEKLLNSLLKLQNINSFVDIEILQAVSDKPKLAEKLYGNNIFKVIFMANSGQISEALTFCNNSKLPLKKKNLLTALIYESAGDVKNADFYFNKSLDKKDNFWGYRDYAAFLISQEYNC